MIYERRGAEPPRVRMEDLAIGDRVVVYDATGIKEPVLCRDGCVEEHMAPKDVSSGNGLKPKGGVLMLMLAIILSLVLVDVNFFDGVYARNMSRFVKSEARQVLNMIYGQDEVQAEAVPTRTLYTLPYADENEEDGLATIDDVATDQNVKDPEMAEVGNTFSENFADGERLYPIISLDLSAPSVPALNNETAFSPDMEGLSESTPSAVERETSEDGPKVLILHTHVNESYTKNTNFYPESENGRSTDIQENVVRTGEEIARTLSDFGIETVHCNTMHDESSFINAYSYSAKTVKRYLEEYPSIRFVIDVHRDAIIKDNGESIKAVTDIAGEDYAQIMFVVGTNELGHNHPRWQQNLSLAVRLQKEISKTYPSLCRSINLRNVPFNQQLSDGYLLLEIGTSANTLEEALRSARAFGENLARVILGA